MIPGNVVFVAFSFPPNRRFYKEIISVSGEVVLRGIKLTSLLASATT